MALSAPAGGHRALPDSELCQVRYSARFGNPRAPGLTGIMGEKRDERGSGGDITG
jgi:hypothetical protein